MVVVQLGFVGGMGGNESYTFFSIVGPFLCVYETYDVARGNLGLLLRDVMVVLLSV